MKKFIFTLFFVLICGFIFASESEYETIFEYGQNPDIEDCVSMVMDPESLVYIDYSSCDVLILYFDRTETNKVKELAFQCRSIVNQSKKNGARISNCFSTIQSKMKAYSKKSEIVYDNDPDLGKIKYTIYYSNNFDMSRLSGFSDENMLSVENSKPENKQVNKGDKNKELVVWSFTDELDEMIKYYFERDSRFAGKYNISFSMTPTDQFPNKLDPVLASGKGCPDVFALEDAFVRKYVESGLLLDLTDVYNEVKDKMYAYPAEVGTYNGKVYALSWQVSPGAFFYNRELAKKYLGTDDPAEVQKYVKDWNSCLDTADLLKEKSKGNCYFVSTTGDLFKPYLASRKNPWIVNGRLFIDPVMEDYLDMCKKFHDRGYAGRISQWSEDWYAGMKGNFRDEYGNKKEVFAYFLPTWGLHYVLKTNAPEAYGKWAMCAGPVAWRWGGTWIGAHKRTQNPNAAKELIKYLSSDDTFLEQYVIDTGDVVSNKKVVNKLKNYFSEPYLAGQNHYAAFASMTENVNGKLTQGPDWAIESLWSEETTAYMRGEKTKQQAIADFKTQVRRLFDY